MGGGGGGEWKTGGKWDEISISPNLIFPIFLEAADLPASSPYKTR